MTPVLAEEPTGGMREQPSAPLVADPRTRAAVLAAGAALVVVLVLAAEAARRLGLPGGALGEWLAPLALVGAGVLLVALVDPAVGLGLLAAGVFTRLFAYAGSERTAAVGYALLVAAVALVPAASRRRAVALLPYLGVSGLYVALGALTVLWARTPSHVLDQGKVLLTGVLLGAGVVAVCTSSRRLRAVVWALVGAGTVVGLLAVVQYITGDYSHTVLGLNRASVAQIVGRVEALRAGGPAGDANFFSQMMVVVLALALERARGETTRLLRTVAAGAAVIAGATIVVTYSRGGLLAAAVVTVVAWARSRHRKALAAAALAGVLVALPFLPRDYGYRLSQVGSVFTGTGGENDPAISGRSSSWAVATHMIGDYPWGGVGGGEFSARYLDYSAQVGRDSRGEARNPHSYPLQVLAETGIVGFAALGAVLVGAYASTGAARRTLRRRGRAGDASLVAGVGEALLGFLAASVFLHNAYPLLFWLVVGLAWSARQLTYEPAEA